MSNRQYRLVVSRDGIEATHPWTKDFTYLLHSMERCRAAGLTIVGYWRRSGRCTEFVA